MDGPVLVFLTGVRPELLEEDRSQLRRGVHVELLARVRVDLGLEATTLVVELLAELLEELEIDADAGVFHAREHAHEGQLDALVELDQLAGAQRFIETVDEAEQQRGAALRFLDAGITVEIEGALDTVGRRELDRQVAAREIFQRVLPLTRIEQIRHQRGVVRERTEIEMEAVRKLLGAVRHDLGLRIGEQRLELLADLGRPEQLGVDVDRCQLSGAFGVGVGGGVGRERHRHELAPTGRARPPRFDGNARRGVRGLQRRKRGRGIAGDDTFDLERLGLDRLGRRARLAERVEDPRQQRAELELVEEHPHAFRVERARARDLWARRRPRPRGRAPTSRGS